MDKLDVRRMALALPDVTEKGLDSFEFARDGRSFCHPYPERIDPKKARVLQYDRFVVRVATADDKEALLLGEPGLFFTTDHYNGWATVIVRLAELDEARLQEVLQDAWDAAPLSSKLKRPV